MLLVVLDGLAGVDDGTVSGLKLGIVVERLADGLPFFGGGINAFESFGKTGFQRDLPPGSFRHEGGKWVRRVLDDGGMAAAGCDTADLDADGDPDLVCIGARTANIKWYENQTK